jgi:hypothetical protein
LAIRDGSLRTEYRTISTYRVDEESEKKLTSLKAGIGLTVVLFSLILLGCLYKIRQYSKSIIETKQDILRERGQLIQYQDEVIKLRQIKLQRYEQLEAKKGLNPIQEENEDENEERTQMKATPLHDGMFEALDGLVSGNVGR